MVNKKNKQLQSPTYSYGKTGFDVSVHSPFGDNYAGAHAYEKTEKIIIALHLVTNSVPEKESVRNTVRDKSICILSDILQLRSGFKSAGSYRVDNVVASIYEVMSLLDILHVAGFVSDMNLEVLKRELSGLIIFIRESSDTELSEKVVVGNGHFNIENIKDRSTSFNIKDSERTFSNIKDTKKYTHSNSTTSASAKHNERSEAILKLIGDKERVNVKDVSAVITDCSEKTIQRELIALIHKGVLKKEGERRWSMYSLV